MTTPTHQEAVKVLRDLVADMQMRAKMRGDVDDDGTVVIDAGSSIMRRVDAILAATSQVEAATSEAVIPRENNEKLCALAKYWKLDGDWMTCKGCKRSLIASRDGEELIHNDGCKFADQHHPWAQLRALIAPTPVQSQIVTTSEHTGWKLVPTTPTEAMRVALNDLAIETVGLRHGDNIYAVIDGGYRELLAAAPAAPLALPATEKEKDELLTIRAMADCMSMVRSDLIEIGIIGKSVAPMFIPEAVAAYCQAAQAKPDLSGLVKIPDGPPIPEWLARSVYEGWKARALLDSTYEQFREQYSRFLSWESIGDLYCDTRAKNGKTPKQVIDAAIALLAHPVAQAKPDVRDAALEEAALACEMEAAASSLGHTRKASWQSEVAGRCAATVRALKAKPEGDA